MSALAGRGVTVSVSTDGSVYNAVTELNDCDMSLAGNTIDVTQFGDTFIEKIQGIRDCSWTLDGFFAPADTNGQVAIRSALVNDTPLYVKIVWDGSHSILQQVKPSKFEVKAAVADTVSVSITLDGSGPVTIA